MIDGIEPLPAESFRDEMGRRSIRMVAHEATYRGFTIKPLKHTQGWLVDGQMIHEGFTVSDGGIINVMPGACWFHSVQSALEAIDDLIAAQDLERGQSSLTLPRGEDPFWALNRFRKHSKSAAPELALALQELLDASEAYIGARYTNAKRLLWAQKAARNLLDAIDDACDTRDRVHHPDGTVTRKGRRTLGRFSLPAAKPKIEPTQA